MCSHKYNNNNVLGKSAFLMTPESVIPFGIYGSYNTLRPSWNGRHFAYIFKCIFGKDSIHILIRMSLSYVRKDQIYDKSLMVQGMTWRRTGTRHSLEEFCHGMMTSSNGNIFRVTGPLCGEFTGHRWITLTKASNAELWCFLWSALE